MTDQGNISEGGVAVFGSAAFVVDRAHMFSEFLFRDEVFSVKASSFITDYCAESLERARAYSRAA